MSVATETVPAKPLMRVRIVKLAGIIVTTDGPVDSCNADCSSHLCCCSKLLGKCMSIYVEERFGALST